MSISRTLNRLVAEVRREARANPEFAARLDAVLRAHVWRGAEKIEGAPVEPPGSAAPATSEAPSASDLNPVAFLTREGADNLKAALEALSLPALTHILGEHHLDPAGAAAELGKDDLVAHIVTQARKRLDRDRKMFEY